MAANPSTTVQYMFLKGFSQTIVNYSIPDLIKWSGSFYKTNILTLLRIWISVCRETCYLALRQVQQNYFKIRQTAVWLHALAAVLINKFSAHRTSKFLAKYFFGLTKVKATIKILVLKNFLITLRVCARTFCLSSGAE